MARTIDHQAHRMTVQRRAAQLASEIGRPWRMPPDVPADAELTTRLVHAREARKVADRWTIATCLAVGMLIGFGLSHAWSLM